MRLLVVAVALTIVFSNTIGAADKVDGQQSQGGQCTGRKDKVGECFKVRGRLRAYAGYPRCRIWPVGTTHLLGVVDPNSMPSNLACGEGFEVYADFLVCPTTEAKPSGMQMVCVASAGNLRASEIKPEDKQH